MSSTQPATMVSLEEMADLLGISLPTMRARTKAEGFPIVRRGTNGVPWQLDPEAVIAFITEQARREEEAQQARAAVLQQYALQIPEAAPEPATPGARTLDPADRLKLAQAALKEDELARQRGFLILTTDMRAHLNDVWTPLAAWLNGLPGQLGRRYNLPDAVVRDMRAQIADQQRALVQRLKANLRPEDEAEAPDAEPEPDDLAA